MSVKRDFIHKNYTQDHTCTVLSIRSRHAVYEMQAVWFTWRQLNKTGFTNSTQCTHSCFKL